MDFACPSISERMKIALALPKFVKIEILCLDLSLQLSYFSLGSSALSRSETVILWRTDHIEGICIGFISSMLMQTFSSVIEVSS